MKLRPYFCAARMVVLIAALASAAVCSAGAAAQEQGPQPPATQSGHDEITAVPNRPTIASTAEAVQRGVIEIEYGFEDGDGHQNINGLVKFGVFKNLELRFLN